LQHEKLYPEFHIDNQDSIFGAREAFFIPRPRKPKKALCGVSRSYGCIQ
jgi:hypothetical protein